MLWINVRVELIRLDNAHSRPDGAVGLLVKVPYKFYNLLEACDTQSISHIDTEYENVLKRNMNNPGLKNAFQRVPIA